MKKSIKIFLPLFLITASFIGCSKANIDNGEVSIELDKGYIHFDAEVLTRGALVEGNTLQGSFYVLGYQYRGDWKSNKAQANPNVFYGTNNQLALPQIVNYNNEGLYTYTPVQAWTGNTYSFFGYYPTGNSNIKLFENGTLEEGEPYITYTLPIGNDPRSLVDVMTSYLLNTNADVPSVNMEMHHRLSAIDVCAYNYYSYDHDNNKQTDAKPVTITITDLQVKLKDVNTSAKIYLSQDDEASSPIYSKGDTQTDLHYTLVGNSEWAANTFIIAPNTKEDPNERVIKNAENNLSIILIPQDQTDTDRLTVEVSMQFQKSYINDSGVEVYLHDGDNSEDLIFNPETFSLTFNSLLQEGRRYYINLTFTSDAVSASLIPDQEWDDKNVKHDFE